MIGKKFFYGKIKNSLGKNDFCGGVIVRWDRMQIIVLFIM